jgi:CHAT domain-containing protein/Tfp pilus assembly protein PilF
MRALSFLLIGLIGYRVPANCGSPLEDYREGWRNSGQGNWQEAIRSLQTSILADPSFEPAYIALVAAFAKGAPAREGELYFRKLKAADPSNSLASYGIADALRAQGRGREAAPFYRDCVEHSSAASNCVDGLMDTASAGTVAFLKTLKTASTRLAFAAFYSFRGRCTESMALGREAVAAAEGEHSALLQAKSHDQLGYLYDRCISGGTGAMAEWKRAEDLFAQAGDPDGTLKVLLSQAEFDCKTGAIAEGLLTGDRLLRLAKEAEHTAWEVRALRTKGTCYSLSGDHETAMATFKQALERDQNMPGSDPASDYRDLILATSRAGRINEALYWAKQSLNWHERTGALLSEAFDLENITSLDLRSGEYFDALEAASRAVELFGRAHKPWQQGAALGNIGDVYEALGDYDTAISYMLRSLESGRRQRDKNEIQRVLANLGEVYFKAGNLRRALECLRESATYSSEVHWEAFDVGINLSLAEVMSRLGQQKEAITRARAAETIARKLDSKPVLAETIESLGERELDGGLRTEAEKDLESGLAFARDANMRPVISDAESALAKLELRRHNPEQAWKHAQAAVGAIEQMRGSIAATDQRVSFLKEKSSAFALALYSLAALRSAHPSELLDQTAFEYAERARSRSFLDMLRDAHTDSPDTSSLGQAAAPLRASDAMAVAARVDCEIVEFFLGEDRSAVFLINATSVRMWDLPPARSINSLVAEVRAEIAKRPNSSDDLKRYVRVSERLYRTLLGPAESHSKPNSKLLIIPDGSLYYLPFEALQTPQRGLLVERHQIAYAPSVSVFAKLRDAPNAVEGKLLALGDPTFGPARSRVDAVRSIYERGGMHLTPVPYTRLEVRKIAGLYPASDRRVYLAGKADKSVFQREDLQSYRILHIASHAFVDDRNPSKSGIVLSSKGALADSLLTVPEIFNLRLNADLVVLSACETGLGKLVKGEGMLGLTRAFLYAGSSRVVVSLWRVDDAYTADLMESFYRHMRLCQSPARALRSAKLEALRSAGAGYAHPYFWAPFIDVGLF